MTAMAGYCLPVGNGLRVGNVGHRVAVDGDDALGVVPEVGGSICSCEMRKREMTFLGFCLRECSNMLSIKYVLHRGQRRDGGCLKDQ